MFFHQTRLHFFRPVTGKYREQVVACLSQLYRRFYQASQADFGSALKREELLEVFHETVVQTPMLQDDEDFETSVRSPREQAAWILSTLLEHGWLEKQVDEVSMATRFHFSKSGRQFTEPFIHANQSHRTRHRNTRSTYNSLKIFSSDQDIYDLIDAWDHSEKIISDFTEVISELDERRNMLVKDMESQLLVQTASDEFFDFMEKRFQPDLAIKLTADGVEKYRDRIVGVLDKIRLYDRDTKAGLERRLRQLLPDLIVDNQSVLFLILDNIEQRICTTSDIIVPQLRRAIQGFTKRADVILRQLSYLSAQNYDEVIERCRDLSQFNVEKQDELLLKASKLMATCSFGFVDPGQNRLQAPKEIAISTQFIEESETFDEDALQDIHIQALLDQAFFVNNSAIRNYLYDHLKDGHSIDSQDLPIESAMDLMAVSHLVEAGTQAGTQSIDSKEYQFTVESVEGETCKDLYFDQRDRFKISLKPWV